MVDVIEFWKNKDYINKLTKYLALIDIIYSMTNNRVKFVMEIGKGVTVSYCAIVLYGY